MRDAELMADPWFVTVQQALAGDYSLERELGRGGMGIVYLAREVALDRLVALKVLPPELAERPELRERFLAEARTAARLSHPNIVPIHRVGAVDGVVFFAMAYIDGETLGARLRKRGVLPAAEVMRIVKEAAWALAYAHRQGVVHRDVKPENILIEGRTGRVVVADFGIAQVGDGAVSEHVTHVSGTAQFMSPEQAMGEAVDGRSDLYALGVMAYLCVSGQLPFDHENPSTLLAQHLSAPVPAITRNDVPVTLSRAIARCLEKSPSQRFASGEALVDMLEAAHATKRQVAPALVKWAEARDPFVPLYLMWDLGWAMKAITQLTFRHMLELRGTVVRDWSSTSVLLAEAVGLVLLPWVASFAFHLVRTWRVIRVGYGVADLRDAIRSASEGEREVAILDARWSDSIAARVLKVATVVSVTAAIGTIVWPSLMYVLGIREWYFRGMVNSYAPYIVFGAGAVVWLASALGVELPSGAIARRFRQWRDRMWNSALGARIASWLGRLAPQRDRITPVVDRPTELALEFAAQRMFDALPTAMRLSMPEFPRVLDQLAKVATRARERQRELLQAQSGTVSSDGVYSNALTKAESDLSDAVQAMERLRLGVMRLYARSDSENHHTLLQSELHAVTAQLERLHRADIDVQRLLAPSTATPANVARRVPRARRWWQIGQPSHPTPTPSH